MGSKWTFKSLNELGVQLIDCMHKTPSAQVSGVPYIGIPQMKNGEIDFEASPRLISESDYKLWTEKANPQYGDIILSRRCNPGETAFVSGRTQFALGQNLVILRTNGLSITAEYLRWALNSSYWWDEVEKYKNPGAIFDSLKCGDVPNFQIPAPPLSIQNKISSVLDSLTDRINLNNKVNKTLEQMSQTLFKSWFVDFDPVIDNALDAGNSIPEALQSRAELRQKVRNIADFKPLPADTRALFPAEFEETELGWVPKGWKEVKLSLLSKITSGKRPPSKFSKPSSINNVPVWGGNGIKWFTSEYLYNERYIITGRVGTLGTFYKVNGLSWPSDNALVIQPVNHEFYELIYQALQTKDILSLNAGSTQPLLTQTALGNITLITPQDRVLLVKFQSICDSFQKKISANKISIDLNTTLRDTLLPKLISGELSLEDLPNLVAQTEPA
ncbi:restriction endonuclease subunit S [Kluyvera georgiana]|uniref:restriction endonuclease subunit S n=1 Tax=Kluyvera georgiana TaxID=73098 RepID=UPI003220597B